ncbi:hypothetical protein Tco_0780275, partial [Tanacetum coccineum]
DDEGDGSSEVVDVVVVSGEAAAEGWQWRLDGSGGRGAWGSGLSRSGDGESFGTWPEKFSGGGDDDGRCYVTAADDVLNQLLLNVVNLQTTVTNPWSVVLYKDRRFLTLPDTGSQCRWIDWVDPPMCPRSVQIIPGLLKARNRHEASIQQN